MSVQNPCTTHNKLSEVSEDGLGGVFGFGAGDG